MTAETLIAYSIALSLFAATPGPGVFATIGQAMSRGTAPALALLSGLIAADIIYLVAAAFGLGIMAQHMGKLFMVIKFVGAAYLIWLGWISWTRQYSPTANDTEYPRGRSFLAGFAVSLSNPKVMVFYLAFLPTFVDLSTVQPLDIAILASLTAILSYVILGFYIAGARSLATSLKKPSVRRYFDRVAGSFLIGSGLFVAARN